MPSKSISVSQIGTLTTCSYKWYLQYRRGVRVHAGGIGPTVLGEVTHFALAGALRGYALRERDECTYEEMAWIIKIAIKEWDKVNRPSEKQTTFTDSDGFVMTIEDTQFYTDWDEMLSVAYQLAYRTVQYMKLLENYEVAMYDDLPVVEYRLEYPIPGTDYIFTGIVDALLYNKLTGMFEIVDWKVRSKFTDLINEQIDMQVGIYQYLIGALLGIDVFVGTVFQIKSDVPHLPNLNKDGTMSKKNITTDWPTYKQALLDAGLEPEDYIDEMLDKLADKEFYRPLSVVRSKKTQAKLWDNVLDYITQIETAQTYPRAYGYPCRNCQFLELCNAELYDFDVDSLFEGRYTYAEWATNGT